MCHIVSSAMGLHICLSKHIPTQRCKHRLHLFSERRDAWGKFTLCKDLLTFTVPLSMIYQERFFVRVGMHFKQRGRG